MEAPNKIIAFRAAALEFSGSVPISEAIVSRTFLALQTSKLKRQSTDKSTGEFEKRTEGCFSAKEVAQLHRKSG